MPGKSPETNQPVKTPPALGITNLHPDHLDVCLGSQISGWKSPCSWPAGTVVLVRRTSGGRGTYGVVGVWYYSGESREAGRREFRWTLRWPWVIQFRSLVQFSQPYSESFTEPVPGLASNQKQSSLVPGLRAGFLQGTLVQLKDPRIASRYLASLLRDRRAELSVTADYLGERVRVDELLERLAADLHAKAH